MRRRISAVVGRWLTLPLMFSVASAKGILPCTSSEDCQQKVGPGSECQGVIGSGGIFHDSFCTNPFASGCLRRHDNVTKMRVCNSDDPTGDRGVVCRDPDFDYMEIRIYGGNWKSIAIAAWLVQILLSELLGVPTTIETGVPGDDWLNFYNRRNEFDLENSKYEYSLALKNAKEMKDCRKRKRGTEKICAHFIPEVWDADHPSVQNLIDDGTIEPPQLLGMIGEIDWFATKFTVRNEPSLATYLGMQGEHNRRKLAETFLRPTTWGEYCRLVSENNCAVDDGVAARAPLDEKESERMFVDGYYTGHFRATEKNKCGNNPTNCTGHIGGWPCGWLTSLEGQTHHLDIALESNGPEEHSGGYKSHQLQEMWRAANATGSNLIMLWWKPHPLVQSFLGTDAEFHNVVLPPVTQECIDNRVTRDDICSPNRTVRIGKPEGACGFENIPLSKIISSTLNKAEIIASVPEAARSPAKEALHLFNINKHQLGEIFALWESMLTPREAVCSWAADNVDYLESLVPQSYPRVIDTSANKLEAMSVATLVYGSLATLSVLLTAYAVHHWRERAAIKYAQITFLWILLWGSLLVSIGAIFVGVPPTSDWTCTAVVWFINIGYTLVLVPLIVKVSAINKLTRAERNAQRVVLKRKQLYQKVIGISILTIIFLIVWTVFDRPKKEREYRPLDEQTDSGETVVAVSNYCSSNSVAWEFASVSWHTLLLLIASVLAFQARSVRQDYKESRTLAFNIYSNFVFVVARFLTLLIGSSRAAISQAALNQVLGMIFGVDMIATMIIYFVPKLITITHR